MAKNVIFGSGIVGLMAKRILAGNWTVIPFSRSRFYSFNPPLGDNFITRDADIDQPIREMTGDDTPHFYHRCYSIRGSLVREHDAALAQVWLGKVCGRDEHIPQQAVPYLTRRMTMPIYATRVNVLYQHLQNQYLNELKAESALGPVTEIGPNYFIRGGVRTDFDRAVSTIPLPALTQLMGQTMQLPSRDEHFVLVKSQRVDLEGCNQALVVDPLIDFYKVTALAPGVYMFCFTNEIPQPGAYLLPIIGNADVMDGTKIQGAIPVGPIPDLSNLEKCGIFSVGSHAQWDWCADVGSNLLRLVRYAARGYQPAQPKTL